MPLVSYNIPANHPSWENFKEGYMVKITFKHKHNANEEIVFINCAKNIEIKNEINQNRGDNIHINICDNISKNIS